MKINWILPTANMTGGTKSNRLIAEAMQRRGHDVSIVYSTAGKPWPSITQPRRCFRRARNSLRQLLRQKHHLQSSTVHLIPVRRSPIPWDCVPDADVTIATWWETMEWIDSWPATKGVHAYFVRGHEVHGHEPERVRRTYRLQAQKLVISTWLQRIMAEEYGDPSAVLVPNGVDRQQFSVQPRSRQPLPTMGFIYDHRKIKGGDTAFAAIKVVQQALPDLRVLCFGASTPPRAYRPRNFEFVLRPRQDLLAQLYGSTDCWLIPSQTEGFGMPGIEAAACRCPLVSTRCGGPSDYLEEGVNGHLVPVDDIEAMADALTRILRADGSSWRAMSDASLEISKRFDWDNSAKLLEDALAAAVNTREFGISGD